MGPVVPATHRSVSATCTKELQGVVTGLHTSATLVEVHLHTHTDTHTHTHTHTHALLTVSQNPDKKTHMLSALNSKCHRSTPLLDPTATSKELTRLLQAHTPPSGSLEDKNRGS